MMDERTAEKLAELILAHVDPSLSGLTRGQVVDLLRDVKKGDITRLAQEKMSDVPISRWQDQLIEQHVAAGSSVLDLGCGDGQLLRQLMDAKGVRGQGVELDATAVFQCVERDVPVFQSDLDAGLKGFSDQSFDYVVLEETVQTLHRPAEVLVEMLRVGRHGIVSFPNFGYWRVRLDLALRGRMPVTPTLPYRWHDTPNIHLLTLQDLLDWTSENGVRVVEAHALAEGSVRPLRDGDNLHAEEVLLVLEKK